jgi:hypothetical protein
VAKRVLLAPSFFACLKRLRANDPTRIEEVLTLMPECFGHPHLHTGVSIRRLRGPIFECRAGLKLRLLFRDSQSGLEVFFAGSHDDVKTYLKSL